MIFKHNCVVPDNHRVLVYRDQQCEAVLGPGKHPFWNLTGQLRFQAMDINQLYLSDKNLIRLYHSTELLKPHITHWKLSSAEVGALYFNGMLRGIVAPNENLYLWKDAGECHLEVINIEHHIEVPHGLFLQIQRSGCNTANKLICSDNTAAVKPVSEVLVDKQHIGLLYVDGRLERTLTPGQYGFWQLNHKVEVRTYDQRTQQLDVSGQEILSRDRVSLRINLSANIRIADVVLAAKSVAVVTDFAYKALQLALREAVGTKSLDELLQDKLYINKTVCELAAPELSSVGISLEKVGLKDIVLPGEMKAILNKVVEAQKAAEANVIKRREETAATRSLHNTAKVMENNPTLLRLKELEALEKISEKVDSLTVHNGLEGLMKGVVQLQGV